MIYTVQSFQEAVDLASQFKSEGRYNLFRGQRDNWPVVASACRLSSEQRRSAERKLSRLYHWVSVTAGLEHYRDNDDATIAVAQHYGLPTTYVDFSDDPGVAAFFAFDGYRPPGQPVLICLDESDFLELSSSMLGIDEDMDRWLKLLEFKRPPTPNHWRMEAQRCVFLNCPVIGIERVLYNFDRILILDPHDQPSVGREKIYPRRKSDLERLFDQFVSLETRLPGNEAMREAFQRSNEDPKKYAFAMPDPKPYYLRPDAVPHVSWVWANRSLWLEGQISAETFSYIEDSQTLTISTAVDVLLSCSTLSSRVSERLELGSLDRSKAENFRLIDLEDGHQSLSDVAVRLNEVWDGIRRLPFSDEQVAACLARFICFAVFENGEEELIPNPIKVEFGTGDGSYSRSVIDAGRMQRAFRPDLEDAVKEAYLPRIMEKPLVALLWVNSPQMLFSFEHFVDLLAFDVIPAQMLRLSAKRAATYSPWRVTSFGLP